jgi:hypothetical protein
MLCVENLWTKHKKASGDRAFGRPADLWIRGVTIPYVTFDGSATKVEQLRNSPDLPRIWEAPAASLAIGETHTMLQSALPLTLLIAVIVFGFGFAPLSPAKAKARRCTGRRRR